VEIKIRQIGWLLVPGLASISTDEKDVMIGNVAPVDSSRWHSQLHGISTLEAGVLPALAGVVADQQALVMAKKDRITHNPLSQLIM
jgi:hypothetical protein